MKLLNTICDTNNVLGVAVFPDCSRIASGNDDNSVKIWDAKTGKKLRVLTGHSDWVWSVAVSLNCSFIVSGSADKSVKVWDAKTGTNLMTLNGHSNSVESVAVFPDCSCIVSGSYDKTVKVWGMVYYPAKSVYILLMKLPLNEDVVKEIFNLCIAPKYEIEALWKK